MGERVLGGRFRCLGQIGRGAQGVVERAWDQDQGRAVALKIRSVEPGTDRHAVLAETRLLVELPPHPNVAFVRTDFFEGDSHVLVMDFVDGPSLATLVRANAGQGLPPDDVIRWLSDIAAALDHLHAQRPPVMHGDVKPANVVISAERRAVLVDFGLAATAGGRGLGMATTGFAAPELTSADRSPASDLYSLAATAYALLTGGPPVPGDTPAVGAEVREVLAGGLAVEPSARPVGAVAFVGALGRALGVEARPTAVAAPVPARVRSRLAAAGVASVAVAVFAVAITAWRPDQPDSVKRAAVAPTSPAVAVPGGDALPVTIATVGRSTPTRGGAAAVPGASVNQQPDMGRFTWFRSEGVLEVDRILATNELSRVRANQTAPDRWDAIARISPGNMLLYRTADAHNRVVTIGADGALTEGRTEDLSGTWSHLTGLDGGLVFFYEQSSGFCSTVRFGDKNHLRDGDSYLESRVVNAGFDRVVHAGANRVLLYASQSGKSLLAAISDSGAFQELARPQLTPGWTTLAATGHGLFIGVGADGTGRVLRSTSAGVDPVTTIALGSGGWSAAARYARGAVLANPAAGRALVVELTTDGRLIRATATAAPVGAVIGALD